MSNIHDTAREIVDLARRYKALGGFSTFALSGTPDVLACVASIAEAEPIAWDPARASTYNPDHTIPATFDLRVDGVSVQVWDVPRPSAFNETEQPAPRARFDAHDRAGALLVAMASMQPREVIRRDREAFHPQIGA